MDLYGLLSVNLLAVNTVDSILWVLLLLTSFCCSSCRSSPYAFEIVGNGDIIRIVLFEWSYFWFNFIRNCINLWSCWDFTSFWVNVQLQPVQTHDGSGSRPSSWSQRSLILVKKLEICSSSSWFRSQSFCCIVNNCGPEDWQNLSSRSNQISLAVFKYSTLLAIETSRDPSIQDITKSLHLFQILKFIDPTAGWFIVPSTKHNLFLADKAITIDLFQSLKHLPSNTMLTNFEVLRSFLLR